MASQIEAIDLSPLIDQALLDPASTDEQLKACCSAAERYGFAAVCVYPMHVRLAVEYLGSKSPQVCAVIGFPTGATTAATKLYEAQEAVDQGATELDVVINRSWLKQGQIEPLHQEVAEICEATGRPVKAILEMSQLTPPEIEMAVDACLDAGAEFLKTSTGWFGGATLEQVQFLKQLTKDRAGIKASGGIRTAEQAIRLVQAGATRLGTSRGPELIRQLQALDATS
ncbi:MAG: deoxyribose-phosphate aldolase [Cyanobacteria bacterium P01_A01_bin.135]